jgi:hypothetical protein
MEQAPKKRSIGKRILRIVLKTVMWIFLLIVVLFLLILTPPVQRFITGKATNYLENKLHTRVEIGRLFITLSGKIAIDNVYLEDQSKDTLISAGKIRVNMSFRKLLFGDKKLQINSVLLEDATAKIKRQLPDTTFNFQFIADAFGGSSPDSVKTTDTTAGMPIDIGSVELNRIRLVYKDIVSGNDVETALGHFSTRIEKFDLDKMHFVIPRTSVRELTARVIQTTPLVIIPAEEIQEVKAENPGSSAPMLQLEFTEIDLQKSNVDYRDSVNAMFASVDLGKINIRPKKLDLGNINFDLGDIVLQQTKASIQMGKKTSANTNAKGKNTSPDTASATSPVRFAVNSLELDQVAIKFDDDNSPRQPYGMDYLHLNAAIPALAINRFVFTNDSVAGVIAKASMKEQSGFQLDELKADFLYTNNQAYIHDLYLKTPGTEIKRDIGIRYASIESLAENIGNLQIDADIAGSRIQMKDVLTFVPMLRDQPAFASPDATWYLDSKITGRVSDLRIERFKVAGFADTRADLSGRITGLPEADKIQANLAIRELTSSRRDIVSFLPKGTLPPNIALPNRMSLAGTIKGNGTQMNTDLLLTTDMGNVSVKGLVSEYGNAQRAKYDLTLRTSSLNLNALLKDTAYGPVSLSLTAKGRGYDMKTANASLKGQLHSATYNKYVYKDLLIDGTIANQQLTAKANMQDPNIHFTMDASANLSQQYPTAVKLELMVDSIKVHQLNLTPDVLTYHGKVNADFATVNPDDLDGKLFVTESVLVQGERRIQLDTIQLLAGKTDGGNYVQFNSDIVNARLQGKYKLTQLGDVFVQTIDKYYAMAGPAKTAATPASQPEPYDFTLNAYVLDKPLLRSLVPGLEKIKGTALEARFSSQQEAQAMLKSDEILIGANHIQNLRMDINTADSGLTLKLGAQQIKVGGSILLDSTVLNATILNNIIDFDLGIKDKEAKDRYTIGGKLQQASNGDLVFSLNPNDLLLNYDQWQVAQQNKIVVASAGGFYATDFTLSRTGQQLSINSTTPAPTAPMKVSFNNFRIGTITEIAMSDSMMMDGVLNGEVDLQNLTTQPLFTGNLNVRDFSYHKDTLGNIDVKVNNNNPDVYQANISLSGKGNDVAVDGSFNAKASSFDASIDLKQLPMKTAEILSGGMLKDTKGNLDGRFKVAGTTTKPSVTGVLNFKQVGLNVAMLNNYFNIENEKLELTEQGVRFNRFQVKDSAGNPLTLNGAITTKDYTAFGFNLDVRADNFRALNSTKKDNKLFYGQLYFDTNLKITGTDQAPKVDGRIAVNDKTKMTIVLPQPDPGVVNREGIIEFVDFDAPVSDSLFMLAYDSLNTSTYTGMDVSLNIQVDKAADFSLVIDEANGDMLNIKGEADLNAGIDPSGKINMTGVYEVDAGSYQLSLNVLKRKFDIQKGSRITWEGEPTAANVDITAIYTSKAAPFDLVKGIAPEDARNLYLQRLPFDVLLKMQGELLKPDISFDITLPENRNYGVQGNVLELTRTQLETLRQQPGEMNKQVFSLLLMNRFVPENPFSLASGGGGGSNSLIKQSVSALMADQLNRLAEGLIDGVDINFGIESSDDYTSGERQDRTDLNVGVSKRLLDDRLTVTVGSDITLEGPQASNNSSMIGGNVAVDYALSADGRYKLRAYVNNDYQGVIDGYVTETGVGFIITVDYNKFRQIFQSKKKRDEERERRRQQRLREQQSQEGEQRKDTVPPASPARKPESGSE